MGYKERKTDIGKIKSEKKICFSLFQFVEKVNLEFFLLYYKINKKSNFPIKTHKDVTKGFSIKKQNFLEFCFYLRKIKV